MALPDQDDHDHAVVERFHPTSGRVTGWMTVVLAGASWWSPELAYLDEGFPPWVMAAGLLVGVLAWAAMLRPALWATHEHLVMRNLAEHRPHPARRRRGDGRAPGAGRPCRRPALRLHRGGPHVAQGPHVAPPSGRPRHRAPRWPPRRGCTTPTSWRTGSTSSSTRRARARASGAGSQEQLALPDAVRREPALAADRADRGPRWCCWVSASSSDLGARGRRTRSGPPECAAVPGVGNHRAIAAD